MGYLPTWVLLFVGLVGLTVLTVRALVAFGRFRALGMRESARYRDETGMLRARSAALRVGIAARLCSQPAGGAPARTPATGTMTSWES